MTSRPPVDRDSSNSSGRPLSGLHYLLIFSAFALVALVLMEPRYRQLQVRREQQYQGIRDMQQREQQSRSANRGSATIAADGGRAVTGPSANGEPAPLILSLRPLILTLAALMLIAWFGIQWKRMRRTAGGATLTEDVSEN